jgi:hypothetical protein
VKLTVHSYLEGCPSKLRLGGDFRGWLFLQISLTNLSARRLFVQCGPVGLYHRECHFVIWEEEYEVFWRGLDLEYLQEDPGSGLTDQDSIECTRLTQHSSSRRG